MPAAEVVQIARRHSVTADSFRVLADMEEIRDPDDKSFFLIPQRASGAVARQATLMTYIVNAGTGYGKAGEASGVTNDFCETPYSAAEVTRIVERQRANSWSYRRDVRFVHANGGRLLATPNGMLMGLGGNVLLRLFSQQGGTAWGDIFMVNIGRCADAAQQLRDIVESGHVWYARRGEAFESNLALDRVLHHEEWHSRQWAAKGYLGMLAAYGWELLRQGALRKTNRLEEQAGLADGGYR